MDPGYYRDLPAAPNGPPPYVPPAPPAPMGAPIPARPWTPRTVRTPRRARTPIGTPASMGTLVPLQPNVGPLVPQPPQTGYAMDLWTDDQVIAYLKMVGPGFDFTQSVFPRGPGLAVMRDLLCPGLSSPLPRVTDIFYLACQKMQPSWPIIKDNHAAQDCLWNVVWHEVAPIWAKGAASNVGPAFIKEAFHLYFSAFKAACDSNGNEVEIQFWDRRQAQLILCANVWMGLLHGVEYKLVLKKSTPNNDDPQLTALSLRKRRRLASSGNRDRVLIAREDIPEEYRNLPNPIAAVVKDLTEARAGTASLEQLSSNEASIIRERNTQIMERDATITECNLTIAKNNATIGKQEDLIAKLQEEVARLNATVALQTLAQKAIVLGEQSGDSNQEQDHGSQEQEGEHDKQDEAGDTEEDFDFDA
ncbi:hypothetical protein F5Y04DRAFT_280905 [Hypomontagnella monticulosa]|nr:hypothetical protein F5Y04DRAFT_280905 [Hypomontagnella monticulosa]